MNKRTSNKSEKGRLFRFKQFSLTDQGCAMKIGTDGVILGAWAADFASGKDYDHILDVGTGCGIIALMVAQKSTAFIDALEPEQQAAETALDNFRGSPWSERLTLYNCRLQEFDAQPNVYDLIVSNPPYFQVNQQASSQERLLARHRLDLSFEDLFHHSRLMLKDKGALLVICPAAEQPSMKLCASHGFFEQKKVAIRPHPTVQPKRVIIEYSFKKKEQPDEIALDIESGQRHSFSDKYKELTRDYHPFL